MATVPFSKSTPPNRRVASAALPFRLAALCMLASPSPAFAQDIDPLGDDVGAQVLPADQASGTEPAEMTSSPVRGAVRRSLPVEPVAPTGRSRGRSEDDPFAAPGLRFGSFVLRPTLELGLTGSRTTGASGATTDQTIGESSLQVDLDSEWDRHALGVSVEGGLQRGFGDGDELEPELKVDATARADLGSDTTLTGRAGYAYETENGQSAAYLAATDPLLVPAVTGINDPATQTFSGGLELRRDFGRFHGEAEASAERNIYGTAKLSNGTSISQRDLDNTVYDFRLRAGVDMSPALSPFIETTFGLRRMDSKPDSGGANRDANRYEIRAGTGFDLGEKLNGEVSAGFIAEDIADAALEDLSGVSFDAALNWSPRRGTDVALTMMTSTEAGTRSGSSGALLYAAELGVTHRARANLTFEGAFGTEYRDARGMADEVTVDGSVALTYWFNRFTGLTTRIEHERTTSSDAALRSEETSAFVGLTLQR